MPLSCFFFFFFNDTATTEIYTLSLHDALPISGSWPVAASRLVDARPGHRRARGVAVPRASEPGLPPPEPTRSVHDGAGRGATIETPRVARRDSGGNAGTTGRAAAGLVSPLAGCAGDRDRPVGAAISQPLSRRQQLQGQRRRRDHADLWRVPGRPPGDGPSVAL